MQIKLMWTAAYFGVNENELLGKYAEEQQGKKI